MKLPEIRAKYPQYNNLADADLAAKLHQKFYPQLAFDDFAGRIGYTPQPAQPEPTAIDRALDTLANSGRLWTPSEQAGGPPPIPDEIAGLPQIVFPKPSLPQSLPSMATAEPMPTPGPAVPDALTSSHVPTVPVMPAHTARPQQNPAMAIPGEAELELGRALQHVPKWHGGDIGELGAGVLGYMLQRAAAGLGFLAHGAGAAEAGPFVDTPKPTLADLAKEAQRTTDTFAHQPPTVEGIHGKTQEEPGAIAKAVSYPFEKAKEYAERASQWVYDNTGSAWLSGLTAAGDELLMAALPFMKRLRGGPGKGVVPVDSTEFGEGLSEGARLRNLAKKDPAAFRAAFEEALKKRMNPTETQPEAPGEAQAAKPAETMGEHFGPQAEAQAPPPVKFANAPRGTAADLPNMPLADLDKVPMEQRVKLLFPDLSDAEAKQVADSVQANVAEGIAPALIEPPREGAQAPRPELSQPVTASAMQQAVDSDKRLAGMVRVDAVGEEGTTLPPGMVQITVVGEHPASGGSFSVDADTNAIAQRLDQEAQRWTRQPPPKSLPGPGGNGDRIKSAYDALKAERGLENIEIADIRDRAGVTQAEIEAYLRRQGEAGRAVTATGDISVTDEHTRGGAVRLSHPERPDLLARIDEREPAQVQLAETQTEPEAKAEHVETAQDIIKTLIDRGFKRIESYGVYSRQLLGRPELTRDEFYKIYDEYAAEFGGKERPARPAEPKPEPEPAPAPKPDVKAAGQVERLRATANRIKMAAEEKFNATRNENTPRRARMAEGARNEAAARIAQAETMLRIADGIESGELKALAGVRAATHVDTLNRLLNRAHDDPEKVSWPTISVGEGVLPSIKRDIEVARGGKALSAKIGYRNVFDMELAKEVIDFSKKHGIHAGVWQLEDDYQKLVRLREMGITNADELRAALEEYAELKAPKKKADPIKKMEAEIRFQKIPGFFPTPKPVREKMMEAAGIEEGMKVLEPSAGKGDIADDIRESGVEPDVVEINSRLADLLQAKGYRVTSRDFMELAKETLKEYDRVLMNPPFERGQDIDHVMAAFKLLKPGGRLVAIMSPGPFFRSDKKAQEFRQWFGENEGEVEDLPAGSFKGIEAFRETGVNAKLVTIYKPQEAEPKPAPKAAPEPEPQPGPEAKTEKAEPLRARGAAGESIYQEQKRNLEMLESRLRDFEKMRDENFGAPSGTASKGLYATELQGVDLSKIEVSVRHRPEGGGRVVTIKKKASEALSGIDERIERLKALQKCFES